MFTLYIIRGSIIGISMVINSLVGYKLQEVITFSANYGLLDWLQFISMVISGLACVWVCYLAFLPISEKKS